MSPASLSLARVDRHQAADCDWVAFIRKNDRVPRIEDRRKPWTYRGWLLYYRILAEEHPQVTPRWKYWFSRMEDGAVMEHDIPRITFGEIGVGEKCAGYKAIDNWVRIAERDGRSWSGLNDLIDWLMFALSLTDQKSTLSEKVQEELYRTVNLEHLLLQPSDYLGSWISAHKGPYNPTAFFPTPHHVVEMMTQISYADGLSPEKTVCDPCVGSGRMLLHASNYSLRLFGMDIDRQMVNVTKINGALYAPWLVRPFPDHFFPGGFGEDTQTGVFEGNSLLNGLPLEKAA